MIKRLIFKKSMNQFIVSNLIVAAALVNSMTAMADSDWKCDIRDGANADKNSFKPCWSVGAGLGVSYLNPDEHHSSWKINSDTDTAWLVYGNYHFKPEWFVELGYIDMGAIPVKDRNPIRRLNGEISYKVPSLMVGYYLDLRKLTGELIPVLPISPFVKFGASAIDNSSSPSSIPYEEQSSVQLALGLGFEWRFHKNWKLRNQIDSFDVDAFSYNLSAIYIFDAGR